MNTGRSWIKKGLPEGVKDESEPNLGRGLREERSKQRKPFDNTTLHGNTGKGLGRDGWEMVWQGLAGRGRGV